MRPERGGNGIGAGPHRSVARTPCRCQMLVFLSMNGILVRIGVDQAYGRWNAPVDPETGRFVYVPIPEKEGTRFHPECERAYPEVAGPLDAFSAETGHPFACLPSPLLGRSMHLDPDFAHLTYGDVGSRRGSDIRKLVSGDLVVFYAGLRPPVRKPGGMVYALVGLFVVEDVLDAADVPEERWHMNAHTRKVKRGDTDIVVRARRGASGRCSRCIPIGEFRNRAYRVRHDVLEEWGGLSVRDGYIQRSARPPKLLDPARFFEWFEQQGVQLVENNFGT